MLVTADGAGSRGVSVILAAASLIAFGVSVEAMPEWKGVWQRGLTTTIVAWFTVAGWRLVTTTRSSDGRGVSFPRQAPVAADTPAIRPNTEPAVRPVPPG